MPVSVFAAVTVTPGSGVFPDLTVPLISNDVGCGATGAGASALGVCAGVFASGAAGAGDCAGVEVGDCVAGAESGAGAGCGGDG